MTKADAEYIETRARNLALMYLTRRDDLKISSGKDQGLDFLITISRPGPYNGRLFGIAVKGAFSAQRGPKGVGSPVTRFSNREKSVLKMMPFPVCLFFFTMEDDKAYYEWVGEPILDPAPRLVLNDNNELKRLTNEEMRKIISRVDKWYDRCEAA
jgi:hypothetical protein